MHLQFKWEQSLKLLKLYNTFFTLSQYHHVLNFLVPIQRLSKLFYLPILKLRKIVIDLFPFVNKK